MKLWWKNVFFSAFNGEFFRSGLTVSRPYLDEYFGVSMKSYAVVRVLVDDDKLIRE